MLTINATTDRTEYKRDGKTSYNSLSRYALWLLPIRLLRRSDSSNIPIATVIQAAGSGTWAVKLSPGIDRPKLGADLPKLARQSS